MDEASEPDPAVAVVIIHGNTAPPLGFVLGT